MNSFAERKREMLDKNKYLVLCDNPNDNIVSRLCSEFPVAYNWYWEEAGRVPSNALRMPVPGKAAEMWLEVSGDVFDGRRIQHGAVALYERNGDGWELMSRVRFNALVREHILEMDARLIKETWLFTHEQVSDLMESSIGSYVEFLGYKEGQENPEESARLAAINDTWEGTEADAQMAEFPDEFNPGYVRTLSLMGG